MDIGAQIRHRRDQRDMTQGQLARRLGISVSRLSHVENGEIPSADLAARADHTLDFGGYLAAEADRQRAHRPPRARRLPPLPSPPPLWGRDSLLKDLDQATDTATDNTAPVVLLAGAVGVGKTHVARAFARRHVPTRYPDGAIEISLTETVPGHGMVLRDPADALADALATIDVPPSRIPTTLDGRIAEWRRRMDGRRRLVVLDDAITADQVRPLLPGAPGSTVLITSRRYLPGLTIRDGALPLPVPELHNQDAADLLARLTHTGHTTTNPSLRRIAAALDNNPLALRAAAAHLRTRAGTFRTLVAELTGPHRLGHLERAALGDPTASLRAAYTAACRDLPDPALLLLKCLGDYGAPKQLTPRNTAELLADTREAASHALAILASEHLITPDGADGYRTPELLRLWLHHHPQDLPVPNTPGTAPVLVAVPSEH